MNRRITVSIETRHVQANTRTHTVTLATTVDTAEEAEKFLQQVKGTPMGVSSLVDSVRSNGVEIRKPKLAPETGVLLMSAHRFANPFINGQGRCS